MGCEICVGYPGCNICRKCMDKFYLVESDKTCQFFSINKFDCSSEQSKKNKCKTCGANSTCLSCEPE